MKKILFALIASVTALGGMSTASAADNEPGSAYIGAGLVGSRYSFDVPGATSSDDHSGNKASGKLFAGYNLDKTWAVEGGYTDFGSQSYNYALGGTAGRLESDSHTWYVAGKGTFPVNEQFNVFGKLGVARNHGSIDATGAAATAGLGGSGNKNALYASVGGEYSLNKNVALTLEYEHYGKNDIDQGRKTGAITAGVRYNF
ncbi:MAG: porin family protein [Sphingomonadaceae bacterium]